VTAIFLTGAPILAEDGWLEGHGVLVAEGRIEAILPAAAAPDAHVVALPPGSLLSPGLVDVQVNGGGGILFNDRPDQQAARAMAAAHRALGTTQILPTLITDTPLVMQQAARVVAEPDHGVLGLHFEGPFLSRARPGVHPPALIRAPEEDDLALLEAIARDRPVLLTIAPESVADALLSHLAASGVVLSAGHSAASYGRTEAALAAGVTGFTHVFNAMPAPESRNPGIVGAALTSASAWCGVIADGIHVHPAMLRVLLAAKPERSVLVSDAMPPTGTSLEAFDLLGRMIYRRDGALRTADGTLAGADICLMDAVRFCVRVLNLPAARALRMASAAPADFLGVHGKVGRIAPGLRADMLLLTQDLAVVGTWLGGIWKGAMIGA
jgi:N-acetylglucosamine-6-phosphate deacetylase